MAKVALLIGVSEYEPGLDALPAAVKDMEAMQRVLQHPEMGGFDQVKPLTNPDPLVMQGEIELLFSDRAKDDLVLLFFSGHGIKDESGRLHFATRITRKTAKGELFKSTAVPASFVHEIMSNSRSKRQVILLDCCFSGAFAEDLKAKDDGVIDLQTQLGGEGRAVLTSSTSTQYAFEQRGLELSIYTHYLVEAIRTGAADQDNDGWISIDELHNYVCRKVKETSPTMTPGVFSVKEGYKILLARSPKDDPTLKYRKEVEDRAKQGQGHFSIVARTLLNDERDRYGISPEDAQTIEDEVLQPYRTYELKLKDYEQLLLEVIKHEGDISQSRQNELKDYQSRKGLRDEDVIRIQKKVAPLREIDQSQSNQTAPSQQVAEKEPPSIGTPSSPQAPKSTELTQGKWKFWALWASIALLGLVVWVFELGITDSLRTTLGSGTTSIFQLVLGSFTVGLIQWYFVRQKVINSIQWLLALSFSGFVYCLSSVAAISSGSLFGLLLSIVLFASVTGSAVIRFLPKSQD